MREIIFRGYSPQLKMWLYGAYQSSVRCYIKERNSDPHAENYSILPETVGQYTGVKDKEGTKIFEGDILELAEIDEEKKVIGVVEYDITAFAVRCENKSGTNDVLLDLGDLYSDSIKIVGNVQNNPELLGDNS